MVARAACESCAGERDRGGIVLDDLPSVSRKQLRRFNHRGHGAAALNRQRTLRVRVSFYVRRGAADADCDLGGAGLPVGDVAGHPKCLQD